MAGLKKILVVDDESSIRFLLSDVLSSNGYEVTEARDGQESLEKMEDTRFDLVITDINMPRLDGIAMLNRMDEAGRKEKVILMTGNPSDQKAKCPEIPRVVTRLLKPFEMDNLLDLIIAVTNTSKYV